MDGGIMEVSSIFTRILMRSKHFILVFALACLICQQAFAIPLPRGVDGLILDLDGTTEAPAGTNFSVCNIANDYCINGTTGYYAHSGRYSTAVKGEDGDTIVIKAWTRLNASNRYLILNGSMHNVNLLLDLSLQYYPPESPSPLPIAVATPSKHHSSDVLKGSEETETITGYSALSEGMVENQQEEVNSYQVNPLPQPDENFVDLFGKITYSDGKEVPVGTKIIIKNTQTGEEAVTATGIAGRGDYFISITGKDTDKLILKVGGEEKEIIPLNKENNYNFSLSKSAPLIIFKDIKLPREVLFYTAVLGLMIVPLALFLIRWKNR